MSYHIDWTLHAPDTFKPLPTEGEEYVKALQNLGYEVKLKAKSDWLEWKDDGFLAENSYQWYRGKENDNVYYYGELQFQADKFFLEISKKYEGVFILDAVGEDGDFWRTYIKGGKNYTVSPTYPEFEEDLLR